MLRVIWMWRTKMGVERSVLDWNCFAVSVFGRNKHDVCVRSDFNDFERRPLVGLDSET
jgi:hypothetical protein